MNHNKKRLLFAVTALLLVLLILAAGLDSLYLFPGRPFDLGRLDFTSMEELLSSVVVPIVIFTLIFLLIVTLVIFVPREMWPNLQSIVIVLTVVVIAFLALVRIADIDATLPPPESVTAPTGEEEELGPVEGLEGGLVIEIPPSRPAWIAVAASLSVALLAVGLFTAALWRLWQKRGSSDDKLTDIAAEAQIALNNLQSGEALRDVIIRCYVEMGRIVSDMRDIQRKQGMTPREFEQRLLDLRLPAAHVIKLTRLFEVARYGLHEASPEEQAEAIASLEAIIAACQETAVTSDAI